MITTTDPQAYYYRAKILPAGEGGWQATLEYRIAFTAYGKPGEWQRCTLADWDDVGLFGRHPFKRTFKTKEQAVEWAKSQVDKHNLSERESMAARAGYEDAEVVT